MKRSFIDLGMLYVGKIGALAVGFFLMPAYSLILGPEQFSTIAFILSLVNAAVALDFGMSTIIGRDSADNSICEDLNYRQLLASLALVILFYSFLFVIIILYDFIVSSVNNNLYIQFYSLILILSSLIQNISISYLNGIKEFRISGSVLFFSVVFRGVASLLVIKFYKNDVSAFMLTQATISLAFAIFYIMLPGFLTKKSIGNRKIGDLFLRPPLYLSYILPLARKGLPLLFMGISATLVMQLDKIVLAHYASAKTLSAYYLAFTFNTIPILAVAGPIKQYFQPHIVSNLTCEENGVYRRHNINFFWCLILFVAVPSAFGYPLLKEIIHLWLGNNVLIEQVVSFSLVLLPAFALGAISYYPTVLLVIAEDYRFQSAFAIVTSVIFAIILFIVSAAGLIYIIPWLFFAYFMAVIVFCSLRSFSLNKVKICITDVIKYCPLALFIIAAAFGLGYVSSFLFK
ncbi:lipopolysaccharide biosynthesis protein [Trabulsiella odontotermitis]|uniref:Putative O-antigen transporter n=1 Tax=Trabulsiella odontotermitis TaxID=379893 RepID=A0A0L0H0M4_9ENTR|nr:oligosaccharide flippase family protein [Trabulsiella odontotermitis]KNC94554.1 hypothetical protein GM31_13745 [Trabulsiella odontotermitis]